MAKPAVADVRDPPSIISIRQLLEQKIHNTRWESSFNWALVGERTLDDFVASYLTDHLPDETLDPCHFDRHLSEASAMLDGCLARQDQILALEGTALSAGLELALAENTHDADLALALIQLQASGHQAGIADLTGGIDNLRSQFSARAESRRARLALHNQDGGPLNYVQRIARLSELFADDIRGIYGRLLATRKGLHSSHVAPNLRSLPTWKRDSSDNLMQLVRWTREAIQRMELGADKEALETMVLPMAHLGYLRIRNYIEGAGPDLGYIQTFEMKPDQFRKFKDSKVRLVNFGIAMGCTVDAGTSVSQHYEDTQRNRAPHHTYSARIMLPKQIAAIAGESPIEWTPPRVDLIDRVPIWQNGSELFSPSNIQRMIENVDPIGSWQVVVFDRVIDPDGNIGQLPDFSQDSYIPVNGVYVRPLELFFSLTVAGTPTK